MRLSVIYCFDHCYISCFIIICCVPHFYLPAPILIVLGDVHFGIVRLQHATPMRWHRMRSTVPRWWDMGDNHTQTRSTSPNIDSVGGDCVVHLYAQIAFAVCIRRWITDVLFVPSIVQRQSQRASASNQRNRNKFIFYFFNLYLSRRSNDDLGKQNHFQVNILLFIFSRARAPRPHSTARRALSRSWCAKICDNSSISFGWRCMEPDIFVCFRVSIELRPHEHVSSNFSLSSCVRGENSDRFRAIQLTSSVYLGCLLLIEGRMQHSDFPTIRFDCKTSTDSRHTHNANVNV